MENGRFKPVRMCVVCRRRFLQENLNRLQCKNSELVVFDGMGRSFYVCPECVNEKKFVNFVSKICKISKEKAKEKISIFHFAF